MLGVWDTLQSTGKQSTLLCGLTHVWPLTHKHKRWTSIWNWWSAKLGFRENMDSLELGGKKRRLYEVQRSGMFWREGCRLSLQDWRGSCLFPCVCVCVCVFIQHSAVDKEASRCAGSICERRRTPWTESTEGLWQTFWSHRHLQSSVKWCCVSEDQGLTYLE
jgi:hypothetical protein